MESPGSAGLGYRRGKERVDPAAGTSVTGDGMPGGPAPSCAAGGGGGTP